MGHGKISNLKKENIRVISEARSLRAPNLCGHGNQEVDVRDPLRQHNDWSPRCIRGSLSQQMDEAPAWGHVKRVTTTRALPARKCQCKGAGTPLAGGHWEKGWGGEMVD